MKYKVELKWAFIFSLLSLLWILGEKVVGLHDPNRFLPLQPYVTMFILIPNLLLFYWAIREKRETTNSSNFRFQDRFKSGIIMTGFITILTPLVQYIISTAITPEYFENVILYVVEKNIMSLEEAEQQFNLENHMIKSTLFSALFGIVASAIMAYLLKQNNHHAKINS